MNILVTVDDNYVRPLRVMLDSFFRWNAKEKVTVYLFYAKVNTENRRLLADQIHVYGAAFEAVEIQDDFFADAPVLRYFPREMYFRLLCAQYMPKTEKRVLYLDPDMLIFAPLHQLYHMDLHGKTIGAVPDFAVENLMPECMQKIGLKKGKRYVNSGMLLIDLVRMREVFSMEKAKKILEASGNVFSFPDQDLINLYFQDDIRYLKRTYNYNCGYGSAKEFVRYLLQFPKKVPVIAHYMGETKPWTPQYYGKYGRLYYRYLKRYLKPEEKRSFRFRLWYRGKKFTKALIRLGRKSVDGRNHI